MKKTVCALTFLLLSSNVAFAVTDTAEVPRIDKAREGNLGSKAAEFFGKSVTLACENPSATMTFQAAKLGSGSVLDEKNVENSTITYQASYLVTAICNNSSTYSGAYREVIAAAVVSAVREGTAKASDSVIKPTKPDVLAIVKAVDLKNL